MPFPHPTPSPQGALFRLVWATALVLSACEGGTNATEEWRVFRIDGHTLSHVALETGVSVGGLKSVNDLRGDFIRDGAGLLVPENPQTRGLPIWRKPEPVPLMRDCANVEFLPVEGRCAGNACITAMADTNSDEPFLEIAVQGSTWRTAYPMPGPVPGEFLHARVDLDGDGKNESVVSVREGVGNGLGVETWKHVVLDVGGPIASFETEDYGFSFVEQPRGCAFLAMVADWRTDQLRGAGLYFLGQLHVLRERRLVAVGPELARRLTYRFDTERWQTMDLDAERRHPLDWFTSTGGFVWPSAPEVGLRCGAFEAVTSETPYVFALEQSGRFELRGWQDPEEPPKKQYDALVDAQTKATRLWDLKVLTPGAKTTARVCESTRDGEPWVALEFRDR